MTFGLIVTLFGLFTSMLLTFPRRGTRDAFAYFSYFDRYPALFWTGFLYNIGVWVGTWIIWFAPGSSAHLDTFRYHPVYDTAIFLSYLTIIPTMTIFVVSVETRFYERYRMFYGYTNEGGTYQQILRAKGAMILVLRQELQRLFRNQGLVTLLVLLFSSGVFVYLGLSPESHDVFQMTTIGAFSNAMVLVLTLVLLYFEDHRGAAFTSLLFLSLNALLTIALLPLAEDGFGLSFAIGSTIAFAFALIRLMWYINEIDYHTFSRTEPRERGTTMRRLSSMPRVTSFCPLSRAGTWQPSRQHFKAYPRISVLSSVILHRRWRRPSTMSSRRQNMSWTGSTSSSSSRTPFADGVVF